MVRATPPDEDFAGWPGSHWLDVRPTISHGTVSPAGSEEVRRRARCRRNPGIKLQFRFIAKAPTGLYASDGARVARG